LKFDNYRSLWEPSLSKSAPASEDKESPSISSA